MSKRRPAPTYTAPADAGLGEREREVPEEAAYNEQRFGHSVSVDSVQSYKERMALRQDRKRKHEAMAEDGREQQKTAVPTAGGLVLTSDVLGVLLPPGYKAVALPEASADVALYRPPEAFRSTDAALEHAEFEGIEFKAVDHKYFSALKDGKLRTLAEVFRIKNGAPPVRKRAMRLLVETCVDVGAGTVLGALLPLLGEKALDENERHLIVKATTKVVIRIEGGVRPYTHQVMRALAPMLIDEDLAFRVAARELLLVVVRAAGLASTVLSLRPDLDHADEYVRNLLARVLAVAATTLGLAKVLPFLKAVIKSKSWLARHTGIRAVHQTCVMLGGGNGAMVLPHLRQVVQVLRPGLEDELPAVRTATATTLALVADSVAPHGIESFEPVLELAWRGLRNHRGRGLAAFLRCVGALVPLMAHNAAYAEYAAYYTRELVRVLAREFALPDDEVRKAVLHVVARLPVSRELVPQFHTALVEPFLASFWTRRTALESPLVARLVIGATARLARLDVPGVLVAVAAHAKDANDSLRILAADTVERIVATYPRLTVELTARNVASVVDAVLYAFQEQERLHPAFLHCAATLFHSLGERLQPHVTAVLSAMLFRLKNAEPTVRQQAADLVALVAPLLRDEQVLRKLILFLYELLGEVFPDVLGAILGALHACIDALSHAALVALDNPSASMLLPTLTPILKNRHDRVQENCIRLVGLIARKHAETINAKEWMRVSFDLLDLLKSTRKQIRIAANATFGHIANTIGPLDVLAMLLSNLRMQERQLRVSAAVAIGVVADTCAPFAVLPVLMSEYRVPERNVQNGILKALSFLFEYIDGAAAKDYLYALVPLLQSALTDRDTVHRQTAALVVKHLAVNCAGQAHGDFHAAFLHLLNLVLPNLYEPLLHVITRVVEAMDALRVVLGNGVFLNYIWAGLFHAAKKVRGPYWKVYNMAYVQNCDAMVPYYPRIDRMCDSDTNYNVPELDVWL